MTAMFNNEKKSPMQNNANVGAWNMTFFDDTPLYKLEQSIVNRSDEHTHMELKILIYKINKQ